VAEAVDWSTGQVCCDRLVPANEVVLAWIGKLPRTYRGQMGRFIVILLVALVAVMVVSLVVAALHVLFWIAVLAVLGVAGLRLGGSMRHRRRRSALRR
jgi:hypothetical protein